MIRRARARHALIALMTALVVAVSSSSLRAAEFNAALRAPEAPGNTELKKLIRAYFDTYARVNAESAAGVLRDKAAYRQWFETQWRLQRAIDARRPLGDLSEFGITPQGDGSYSVDIQHYPQWDLLDRTLTRLLNAGIFAAYETELKRRGFRDQDVEIMRAYVTEHQPRQMALPEIVPLAESFAARTKAKIARKERIDKSQVLAYTYQNSRQLHEATRVWAVGLLDSLDKQRQRILESFFREEPGVMAIAPDDVDAQVQGLVSGIMSGEFDRMLEAEKTEVRQ